MSPESWKRLACRAKSTASVIGVGICIAFASAQQALSDACVNNPNVVWLATANEPGPDDERAIRKLLSTYNWALDDHRAQQLDGLFADTIYYEMCNAAGDRLAQATGVDETSAYLNNYFKEFVRDVTQTRHIESNTLLDLVDADTVRGKSTVVVTLQHSDIETPVLDYTGVLRTEFTKVDNVWKFSKITLITDGPRLELRAR